MILAAAIKYHIDATDEDVVLCGYRHGDIFDQIKKLGFEPRKGYKEIEQGFIDHNGQFLDRREAFKHAKQCGQIAEKVLYDYEKIGGLNPILISEDLW